MGNRIKTISFLFGLSVLIILWILIPITFIFFNSVFNLPVYIFGMFKLIGLLLIILGLIIALTASLTFIKFGKGTPAITEPPKKLVIKGLYKRTRNPIYVAHLLIYLGLFISFGHILLFSLFIIGFITLQLYIIKIEEPLLGKRYGQDYLKYTKIVPRWL